MLFMRQQELITSKLLKEFKIKTHFYNQDDFNSLETKINKKQKMIFVENPGSNTFESKIYLE